MLLAREFWQSSQSVNTFHKVRQHFFYFFYPVFFWPNAYLLAQFMPQTFSDQMEVFLNPEKSISNLYIFLSSSSRFALWVNEKFALI